MRNTHTPIAAEGYPFIHGCLALTIAMALSGHYLHPGFFLVAEHKAHVLPFLPFLLLLACPLMHVFMHRGHGDHNHRPPGDKP